MTGRLIRTLLVGCVVWAFFVYAGGRAIDHEAQAGSRVSSVAAIRQVFGPRAAPAIRVARCESRLNPRAVGRAGERGLFQIHPVHFSWAQPRRLFEPVWNARVAYRLSRGGRSWRAWTCKP